MSDFTDASVRDWQFGPSFTNGFPSESALAEFTDHFKTPHPKSLLAYWRGQCSSDEIPSREDLHPSEMKPLLERLSIWERCSDGEDNLIRLIGTLAAEIFERDPSGMRISACFPSSWADLLNRSNACLYDKMQPLYASYNLAPMGRGHVGIEHLALPLRRGGSRAELSLHAFARLPSLAARPTY